MDQLITVYLHSTETTVSQVQVHAGDSVSVLYQFLDNDSERYFYLNDAAISPAFSFAFIGLRDGDHIFAIPKPVRPIQTNLKPKKTVPVRARLVDQFHQHIEGTVRAHRTLMRNLFASTKQRKDKTKQPKEVTMLPEVSQGPSTAAFPVEW